MKPTDWKDILGTLGTAVESDDTQMSARENTPAIKKEKPKKASIFFERKGRAGKPATILADFEGLDDDALLQDLASDIKRALGTGGSCRGGEILIQGDRRDEVRKFLNARGFKVKG